MQRSHPLPVSPSLSKLCSNIITKILILIQPKCKTVSSPQGSSVAPLWPHTPTLLLLYLAPVNDNLLSISETVYDSKVSHTVYDLLILTFFIQLNSWRFIQVEVVPIAPFFPEWYSVLWVFHSVYNHSPLERQLGYFQCLAITNKVVMNIPV